MKTPWSHTEYHPIYAEEVPKTSGVYAVLRTARTSGIPMSSEVLYVGKSKNLQKRFRVHTDPYRQHNPALNAVSHQDGLEFWYRTAKVEELDALERELIRSLDPAKNVVRYANAHH